MLEGTATRTRLDDGRAHDRSAAAASGSGSGSAAGSASTAGRGRRSVRRRRSLPSGRAAVGAFLVTVAAMGTYVAATGATADARRPYLVARADLPLGHRITQGDLAVGRMQLPPYLGRGHAFSPSEARRVIGAVALGPIARGELIQAALLSPPGAPVVAGTRQLSFAVESARAVGGSLRPGEAVDVLATLRGGGGGGGGSGGSGDGTTALVARGARIVTVRHVGGLSGGDGLIVTVQVATPDDALALARAVDAGQVTLVRSS